MAIDLVEPDLDQVRGRDVILLLPERIGPMQEAGARSPETSFADDVAAARRVLDQQDGPTLLVGHSYGGSVITEAGVHRKVAGLVYVAAHAPEFGKDEAALGRKTPGALGRTAGAIRKTPDGYTYLEPFQFPPPVRVRPAA